MAEEASVLDFRKGELLLAAEPLLLLLRAISAKEVTRGGTGGEAGKAPSLRRTGQLSMRSREARRAPDARVRSRSWS